MMLEEYLELKDDIRVVDPLTLMQNQPVFAEDEEPSE